VGNNTYIEINGKKYDTETGKQIVSSTTPATATTVRSTRSTGSIDGFSRRKSTASHSPAKHAAKSPQKSQTLMRKSVKKPLTSSKSTQNTTVTNGIKKSSLGTQQRRIESAKHTIKSPHVDKYGPQVHRTSIARKQAELTVRIDPSHNNKNPVQPHASKVNSTTAAQKRKLVTERMIESALHNAQSHEEVHHPLEPVAKKRRKSLAKRLGVSSRSIAMSSAALAVVLLAGFFAVQNVPNFAMRVAATRAGFDAELPGYKPAGFSFKGPINYSAGKVTVSFRSNSDTRAYDLTQQSSKWNSDALLSNFVVAENKQYQTYQDRGRTLYIYDGSSATWVDNGIWYQIEGDSEMTADQLVRIASSI
jgi:hypothetical protein